MPVRELHGLHDCNSRQPCALSRDMYVTTGRVAGFMGTTEESPRQKPLRSLLAPVPVRRPAERNKWSHLQNISTSAVPERHGSSIQCIAGVLTEI